MRSGSGRRRRAPRAQWTWVASRVRLPALLFAFALVYGTVGYQVLEGFSALDALYMTVTTLTTIGFGEIEPLGPAGRVFTLTLILFGVVAAFALLGAVTSLFASGDLARFLQRRAMRKRTEALHDHCILCAFGRVGRAAAEELGRQGADLVVIESKPELEPLLEEADLPYLIGDPTEEAVLEAAGIRRAKALICAVDSDAINVYITLTARAMNPSLFIISRASSPESVSKLVQAGSNRVVSPYSLSGTRMAALSLQPAVLEFVDMVTVAPNLRIEEVVLAPGSHLVGQTVQKACSPYEGVMILAVKRTDGTLLIPPRADTELHEGDFVIAVGDMTDLSTLAEEAT